VWKLYDPNLAASAGVLALLMISPLVWIHYYVLALLPALWLLSRPHWRLANLAGGLYILLVSAALINPLPLYLWGMWIPYLFACSSALLLAGVLAALAGRERRHGLSLTPSPTQAGFCL
jgi:hypothetical protein